MANIWIITLKEGIYNLVRKRKKEKPIGLNVLMRSDFE